MKRSSLNDYPDESDENGLVFLGDCAHPFKEPPHWASMPKPWGAAPVVLNLEGALLPDGVAQPEEGLFNRESVLAALEAANVRVAFLANNHLFDMDGALERTLDKLAAVNSSPLGVGRTRSDARAPVALELGGRRAILLGYGWTVVGCRDRGKHGRHLNELDPARMIQDVRRFRQDEPSSLIIIVVHWNYELEPYPQPGHRQLARELIRSGADAVIGHHPHLVSGIEFFDGKPVVYSVGNWWLPQGRFRGGRVAFPADACLQLAFEYRLDGNHRVHWFNYDPDRHILSSLTSEDAASSKEVARRTPFASMPESEYLQWFKVHRHKKRLLPVFRDYRAVIGNRVREEYVWLRHKGLMVLEATGLRGLLRL